MSDSDWWFLDLAAVVAVTGALTFSLFANITGPVRILIAIPLVCFLPGYVLVSVLFPDDPSDEYRPFDEEKTGLSGPLLVTGGLKPVERFAMSVVCSIAIVPAIALFSSATGGVELESMLLGISLLTVVLAFLAIITRARCPPERRFAPSLTPALPLFSRAEPGPFGSTNPRPYNLAIVIGVVLLVASAGFAIANPPQHEGFTEFSVDTEPVTGDTETLYDARYVAGESNEVTVSITNQEYDERTYTVVAVLQRVSADGGDVTVEEQEELNRQEVTVADGATQQQPFEVTPTMDGSDLRLTFLLYEDDPPSELSEETAYRSLHLPIEVEPSGATEDGEEGAPEDEAAGEGDPEDEAADEGDPGGGAP